jgi:hypothetical protein
MPANTTKVSLHSEPKSRLMKRKNRRDFMPTQRIFTTAVLTVISLMIASMYLQSPYQLWLLMAGLGLVTGAAFKTGQRHVITGFGIGITITLFREVFMYGAVIIEITGLVYAAGYLFAVATTLAVRGLMLKFSQRPSVA